MSEVKHTPTPWHFVEGINYGYIHHSCGEITSDVADMYKADAAFIVRAVNAHDELVEACVQAIDFMATIDAPKGRTYHLLVDALAKAKGA